MARLDFVRNLCEQFGIEPEKSRNRINKDTGERYKESTIEDCIKAIQKYYYEIYKSDGTLSPFTDLALQTQEPMLALQIKHLKPEVEKAVWEDNSNWVFEEKIDGTRIRMIYVEGLGIEYYSRNLSEATDFMPIRYGQNLKLPDIDFDKLKEAGIHSFIIDGELVPYYKEVRPYKINVKGEERFISEEQLPSTGLSLTVAILGALPELAHRIQEYNPLKIMAFDCIYYNGNFITNAPLRKRLELKELLRKVLSNVGLGDRIQQVPCALVGKEQFYDSITKLGGEGCVAKDLDSIYEVKGERSGRWCKIKRSVMQSMNSQLAGDTVDGFVTGYVMGTPGTKNENKVVGLTFSTYLVDDENNYIEDANGNPIIHEIATISNFEDSFKDVMTHINEKGEVVLNPVLYNKVAEIDGQDISSNQKKLTHAVFKMWRMDRSSESCKFRKSILDSLVL